MSATRTLESPLGKILVEAIEAGLRRVTFDSEDPVRGRGTSALVAEQAVRELGEYFAGTRRVFDVPLAAQGTDFQRRAWRELAKVPFGATRSYLDLALSLGDPGLTRAVGAASGANPIAIIVPCHRIVGVGGQLTGYAGGVERKAWLLEHEGAQKALPFA